MKTTPLFQVDYMKRTMLAIQGHWERTQKKMEDEMVGDYMAYRHEFACSSTTSAEARTSSRNVTSRFCDNLSIILSHYA